MNTNGIREGNTMPQLAGDNQLELLQVIDLNPMLEHMQEIQKSSFPDVLCLRPPHSSGASIIITRSSFYRTASTSVDSSFSMSNLKSQSILDKLHP